MNLDRTAWTFPGKTNEADAYDKLADLAGSYYDDPLGFVCDLFPWGEPGPLQDQTGPDTWQREALEDIARQVKRRCFDGKAPVDPIRMAVSSGHGIGKSTLQAWLVCWIMSTRPRCRGTVTANTATQLDTKTWAAIQHWAKLCATADFFEINTQRFYFKGARESWFCAPQSCKEENSEAFAGQHAATSTSFYIIDEASNVPDKIFEVAEGGLTDGEAMIFVFGNCTRSQGQFYKISFGSMRHRWGAKVIDARTSKFTNKKQIAEWLEDCAGSGGEDSDFFRVRVRGLPPSASDLQFIDSARVFAAQKREVVVFDDEPLVAGLDVARGGSDNAVVWFRRGLDARSIPPIIIPGEQVRDSNRLVARAVDVLNTNYNGRRVDMLFIDGTGVGGPIYDRLVQLRYSDRVAEVQFGSTAPETTSSQKYANMRAFMWGKTKEWLLRGAIPEDAQLEADLTGPGYTHDKSDRIVLESKESMKKRGLDSPDRGDGLCLTFAQVVAPKASEAEDLSGQHMGGSAEGAWMA